MNRRLKPASLGGQPDDQLIVCDKTGTGPRIAGRVENQDSHVCDTSCQLPLWLHSVCTAIWEVEDGTRRLVRANERVKNSTDCLTTHESL